MTKAWKIDSDNYRKHINPHTLWLQSAKSCWWVKWWNTELPCKVYWRFKEPAHDTDFM